MVRPRSYGMTATIDKRSHRLTAHRLDNEARGDGRRPGVSGSPH